jgi:hypothetical protein
MTVLSAVVHVWPAVVVEIFAGALHSILKATALDIAAHSLAHIRATLVVVAHLLAGSTHLLVGLTHLLFSLTNRLLISARQVRHTPFIAAAKAITIGFPLFARKAGIAVLVAIVHVRLAVIAEILARAFNAILETFALNLLQFLRRGIPVAAILGIGSEARRLLGLAGCLGHAKSCGAEEKGRCRYCHPIESHGFYLLCFSQFPSMLVLRQG